MKKVVLIVDDFKNTRHIVSVSLKKEGYIVLEAEDGIEALKLFDGRKIDLLITDLNMPNLNGLELAEEVKHIPQYRYMPILMLSTETNAEKKQKAKDIGITGWIQKPFQMARFLKFIVKAMQ